PDAIPVMKLTEVGSVSRDGYEVKKGRFEATTGLPLPALLLLPKTEKAAPLIVCVHDQGAATAAAPGGVLEKLARSGRRALAVDLRGYGETAAGLVKDGKMPAFGVEFKESFLSFHLNQPLLTQRLGDLLGVINTAPKETGVELVGFGSAAPVVLHAAM